MPNISDKPFVAVVWNDAKGAAVGELTEEEVLRDWHQPQQITTYGLLIRQDDIGVTIAAEITGTDPITYRGLSFIPAAIVVSVADVKAKRRKKVPKSLGTPLIASPQLPEQIV